MVLNGNFGDPVLHPNLISFLHEWKKIKSLGVEIATNGGVKSDSFWSELGEIGYKTVFGIDGLKDTHYRYRNTDYDKVIHNMKKYIDNGGHAVWQFIVFDYNYHQIDNACELAKKLGCKEFSAIRSNTYDDEFKRPNSILSRNEIMEKFKDEKIYCYWKERDSFFINMYGDVHPCCHIGPYFDSNRYDDIRPVYLENKDQISLYENDIDDILKSKYIRYVYDYPDRIWRCKNTCGIKNIMPFIKRVKYEKF
jgi:MoaA/NifB/PqqE/SkfB family radical SAM enzyme